MGSFVISLSKPLVFFHIHFKGGKRCSFKSLSCLFLVVINSLHVAKRCVSNETHIHLRACMLSHVQLYATPRTVAHQAPLSMGFSRQEYWSGLPFPSPGDLPTSGTEPRSPVSSTLQVNALPLSHRVSPKLVSVQFSSVQFSSSVVSDSLQPHCVY